MQMNSWSEYLVNTVYSWATFIAVFAGLVTGVSGTVAFLVGQEKDSRSSGQTVKQSQIIQRLEAQQGRRLTSPQQQAIATEVRLDAKEQVAILYPKGDLEAFQYADDIAKPLRLGGFQVEVMESYGLAGETVGLLLTTHSKSMSSPQLLCVQAALTSAKIQYHLTFDDGMSFIPWIVVGRKQ